MDVLGLPCGEGNGQFPGTGAGQGHRRRRRWFRRRNCVPLTVITSVCVISLIYTSWHLANLKEWGSIFNKYLDLQSALEHPPRNRCPLPKTDPFAFRMMAVINMTIFRSNHSCRDHDDLSLGIFKGAAFRLEKGYLLVRLAEFPDDVSCCFQVVTKIGDEYLSIEEKCTQLNQTTAIQPPTEVVMVTCKTSKGQNYYKDAFQIIQEKSAVEGRIKTWREEQLKLKLTKNKIKDDDDGGRLSVIIFGMDSVSQAHFERSMPLTKSYLDKNLKAVKLQGYGKVGSGTFPNAVAFLSGLSDEQLSSACLTNTNRFGRDCPFIWNIFGSNGYRTAYFDEETKHSIFNLRYYDAFGEHPDGPTDYYGRPYALLMGNKLNFSGVCHGPGLSFQHLLDNLKTMADIFNSSQRRYFNFVWSSSLSHKTLNTLPWGDKPLLETLEYLHDNGHLNHTALFLLADHGFRLYDGIYEGMVENRMPLAYIVLPPWFSKRYPKAFENLRWNAENSVASPFDMHKTLQDVLDLERFEGGNHDHWRANRYVQPKTPEIGQSLFELNLSPQGRNCEAAGIPPFWCLCYEMAIPLGNDSFLAVAAAEAVINGMNRMAEEIDPQKCAKLQVAEILNATAILFDGETWEKPECRRIIINNNRANSSDSCGDKIYVSVRVRGSPHDLVYQTMMLRNSTGGFSIPKEIVREDWYSDKGHCVHNILRPYCVCKDFQ